MPYQAAKFADADPTDSTVLYVDGPNCRSRNTMLTIEFCDDSLAIELTPESLKSLRKTLKKIHKEINSNG